jgi:hypothetical protein
MNDEKKPEPTDDDPAYAPTLPAIPIAIRRKTNARSS